MKLCSSASLFDFAGIPIIGNLSSGFVIGLTATGHELCQKLAASDIPESEIQAADHNLFTCLLEGGFFTESTPPQLQAAYLHVTQRCNMNCVGCYSLDASRNVLEDAPFESLAQAIDELAKNGISSLFISGGEPFLRNDLAALVERAKHRGISTVTVITNGTCVSNESLAALAAHVDTVAVSFDGYSADAPSYLRGCQRFNQLIDTVKRVQGAGIAAHIIPTVHKSNVHDLRQYVDLSAKLGTTMNYSLLSCNCSEGSDLAPFVPGDEELRDLADEILGLGSVPQLSETPVGINLTARVSCGTATKEISVAADGTVYPCHMLHYPELALGNIFETSLACILESPVAQHCAQLDARDFNDCSSCDFTLLCGGGCRARSYYQSGNLENRDPYCEFMKTFYEKMSESLSAQVRQRS